MRVVRILVAGYLIGGTVGCRCNSPLPAHRDAGVRVRAVWHKPDAGMSDEQIVRLIADRVESDGGLTVEEALLMFGEEERMTDATKKSHR